MVQKFNTLGDAIRLAEFAHFNQVDKAGLPYIDHPRRVLEKVKAQGALPYVQMAAILHDVTEDTKITSQTLLTMGFPESAVNIVDLLDRHTSKEKFTQWNELFGDKKPTGLSSTADEFYYRQIKQNHWATMVKLADIEDNLSPWRLVYLSEDTQERLQEKYARAKNLLA